MYKHYSFFDKNGEYLNFSYNEDLDLWQGEIDFKTISVDLIEDYQIYILEEVFDSTTNRVQHSYPLLDYSYIPGPSSVFGPSGSTASAAEITSFFSPTGATSYFLYDIDVDEDDPKLIKYDQFINSVEVNPGGTYVGGTGSDREMKLVSSYTTNPIQLNLGFCPHIEHKFESILYIKDANNRVFAEIQIYGEGEEEDQRFLAMLDSLGLSCISDDSIVFDNSDIFEESKDWRIINRKRKELLLEHSNIAPYLGSYRAIINGLKFFGYQNVRLKEYWLNINEESKNYGKFRQTNIVDIFDKTANFRDAVSVPSKIYKKTSKFGLFYDITKESGDFDNEGIPIVEEVYTFSPKEILIKIYALKRKLKEKFLPLNARIVDIVGEAVYFGKYDIKAWNDQTKIDSLNLAITPEFQVLPDSCGYIQDLRPLYYFGCPVGPDLTLDGTSNLYSWQVGIGNTAQVGGVLDGIQTYRLRVNINGYDEVVLDTVISRDTNTVYGQTAYGGNEVADLIINTWKSSTEPLLSKFNVYQEGGNSGIIRIVEKEVLGGGTIHSSWFSNTTGVIPSGTFTIPGLTGGTSNYIDISPGSTSTFSPTGASSTYYKNCFIGYFNDWNTEVSDLNDAEDIPVGYPIVLQNNSFDITWDQAEVIFNDLDILNPSMTGPTATKLYEDFDTSFDIIGWTSINPHPDLPAGATYVSIGVTAGATGFPSYSPTTSLYNWETLGYYNHYEMQWIVSKEEDDTPEFLHDSGRREIRYLNDYPLILPYEGTYQVELRIWDLYNSRSFRVEEYAITVKMPDIDIIGWRQGLEKEYNLNTKRYIPQSVYSRNHPEVKKYYEDLTWDEYNSTWDLPFHPNEEMELFDIPYESIDGIEFYQSITNEDRHLLVDRDPYYFHKIDYAATWNDSYHLWWDGIGSAITQFGITGSTTGATAIIFMSDENCQIDITNPGINMHYRIGPTGFTGTTANTGIVGASGDIIYCASNQNTYVHNGTWWKIENIKLDAVRLINSTNHSTTEGDFKYITYLLNETLEEDGFEHRFLKDFIYYFNMEYTDTYSLTPYITAVSKTFEKEGRHKIRLDGLDGDTTTYRPRHFGYMGDLPIHFEIYRVDPFAPTGTIMLDGMTAAYEIGSTNLTNLTNELNGPSGQQDPVLGAYTYNMVYGYSGWTGPTAGPGPTTGYTEVKMIASSKYLESNVNSNVVLTGGIFGSSYSRSITKNPTWNNIKGVKYQDHLPLLSLVNFSYDAAKMYGKKNPVWKLEKEKDTNFPDIYDRNRFFSFLFTEKGSYTISLELEDTNSNKATIIKKELIKIV